MSGVAIVTGANSGIGFECCRQLLARHWTVHALDLRIDALAGLCAGLHAGALHPHVCDVANAASIDHAMREIAQDSPHVHALICSAGVLRTAPLADMSDADFDLLFAVNARGPWRCAKAALPLLRAGASVERPARIVMVASIAAWRPKAGGGAYAASKAALNLLMRVLAVELGAAHLRVNAVAPGTVDTPMIRPALAAQQGGGYRASGPSPVGRIAEPRDIADVVMFLLGDGARYVNGAMIPVDGGTSAALVSGNLPN
jgi:NAD(P)-dependent dehydrogenase (short-subunit alcohol dehydrogenase family)